MEIWFLKHNDLNTLRSGHAEMHDCSPVHCWRVTHFYVFLIRRPARLFVILPGSLIASGLSTVDAGCLGLKLQINRPVMTPTIRTIRHQQRDHSFRYPLCFPSVAVMALRRNVLEEDDILCDLYVDTRSDVSDYSDNESLDSDSDVPTTSSQKQLQSSTGPLTSQFPHPFFLTSIKIIFITAWD